MPSESPSLVLIAGPNGAGKSTAAPLLLRDALAVDEFVNADVIAQGLSGFQPERSAIAAGRVMLTRLRELAVKRQNFAFETTLASKTFGPWIQGLRETGYLFHLVFLWLPDPEMAVARVAVRVRRGGHAVPREDVLRRYQRGIHNFFEVFLPIADTWKVYNGAGPPLADLIAKGGTRDTFEVRDDELWRTLNERRQRP